MKMENQMKWATWSILAGAAAIACDYDVESEHETEKSISSVLSMPASFVESTEELENMRRHIKSLYDRNDVIHTFKAVSGDVVDCVPLQAQPAMRAPGMEGHVIMSVPNTVPTEIDDTAEQGVSEGCLPSQREVHRHEPSVPRSHPFTGHHGRVLLRPPFIQESDLGPIFLFRRGRL